MGRRTLFVLAVIAVAVVLSASLLLTNLSRLGSADLEKPCRFPKHPSTSAYLLRAKTPM